MTRDEAGEFAKIVQAYSNGKTVQRFMDGNWVTCHSPTFNPSLRWRVKPEPKEWWSVVDNEGDVVLSYGGKNGLDRARMKAKAANSGGHFGPYTVMYCKEVENESH